MGTIPLSAVAHDGGRDVPPTLGTAFTAELWVIALLVLTAVGFALGLRALWGRAGVGAGVSVLRAVAFATGLALLFLAFIWPLDALGEWSFAAHMAQHMVLMAAAPPLLVAGRPGPVLLAALPAAPARRVGHAWRAATTASLLRALVRPGPAMVLQLIVMWGWHAPAAMELALRSEPVHYAMHLSFLGAGLVFWTALANALRDPDGGAGAGAAALAGTMLQMGLLSALLTFGPTSRYPFYVDRAPVLGLTPLEDQQLAGLIMWVPGAVPYVIGALVVAAAWLHRSARLDH